MSINCPKCKVLVDVEISQKKSEPDGSLEEGV